MFIGKKGIGSYSLEHLRSEAETVVFLASGTGEAPHTQMIAELLSENRDINIVSAVSCRFEKDFAYREAYKKLEDENPNFFYYTTSTRRRVRVKEFKIYYLRGYSKNIVNYSSSLKIQTFIYAESSHDWRT